MVESYEKQKLSQMKHHTRYIGTTIEGTQLIHEHIRTSGQRSGGGVSIEHGVEARSRQIVRETVVQSLQRGRNQLKQ